MSSTPPRLLSWTRKTRNPFSAGYSKIEIRDGEVVSKEVSGEICDIDKEEIDTVMRDMFRPDYEAVKAFTVQKVGELAMPLKTRDAFVGMCDYMNLIHRICLDCTDADLSFAAPLSFNSTVNAGDVLYNDLFTIYPYENQIFVLNMKGREIEKYLEYSYDQWINTLGDGHAKTQGHALKIQDREDPRSGAKRWSFVNRSYNFDSLGGAFYTVDLSKPFGDRVEISRLAAGLDRIREGKEIDLSACWVLANALRCGTVQLRKCRRGHTYVTADMQARPLCCDFCSIRESGRLNAPFNDADGEYMREIEEAEKKEAIERARRNSALCDGN